MTSSPTKLLPTSQLQLPQRRSSAPGILRETRTRPDVSARALFSPPPFEPEKLSVNFGERVSRAQQQTTRRYTLTHNDVTGAMKLSVGLEYNFDQISGLYNRLLRDEVMAEWRFGVNPSLHIFVHVSGEEKWLAPPTFRNFIFRRELPLVLDAFLWADKQLLEEHPELAQAEVFVHFESCQQELNKVERWGVLGDKSTWQASPVNPVRQFLENLPLPTQLVEQIMPSPEPAAVPAAAESQPAESPKQPQSYTLPKQERSPASRMSPALRNLMVQRSASHQGFSRLANNSGLESIPAGALRPVLSNAVPAVVMAAHREGRASSDGSAASTTRSISSIRTWEGAATNVPLVSLAAHSTRTHRRSAPGVQRRR